MSNSKPQMLLLEPKNELKFYGPYDPEHHPTCKLTVTNPTPYSIYFKIKTTASYRYYVSPKMGLVLPYDHVNITIGMKAPQGPTQDKFKLVAMIAPGTVEPSANVWDHFDETEAMCSKLVVVFIDEQESDFATEPAFKSEQEVQTVIPSLTKIFTFIVVGFVAVACSLYRLGTR